MQIEKHIKIIATPTGAVVFFGGQVCLSIRNAGDTLYFWSVSPVFAKLTTGATFTDIPYDYTGYSSMAEAIAAGLTRLDELKMFYGVVDMPEDTYVGEHLAEEVDMLSESFVVRMGVDRDKKPRTMISAEAVFKRAKELAKEAGEKMHPKFVKSAHKEFSAIKAESEEFEGDQIKESFNDTDTVFLTPQTGPMAHMRYNTFKEGSAAEHKKAIKYHTKDADRATPQKAAFHDMRAKLHKDYLSGKNEEFDQFDDDQIEEGLVDNIKRGVKNIKRGLQGWGQLDHVPADDPRLLPGAKDTPRQMVARNKGYDDKTVKQLARSTKSSFPFGGDDTTSPHSPRGLQKRVLDREMKKRGLTHEEFVQYEDALPSAFASIKEDCRAEALAMTDSLVEAQQLANELFEDIVEEYLNELSKGTLKSYIKNASRDQVYHSLAADAETSKPESRRNKKSYSDVQVAYNKIDKRDAGVDKAFNKLTKEEVEEIDEASSDFATLSDEKARQKAETDKIKKDLQARAERDEKNMKNYQSGNVRANFKESVDEAALSGDAYWKAKEDESKQEFLKAQRKALGLPEPVKRGRGKPTNIDRDLLKTRAHSNVEAGHRPTAGFDRNEKIHFIRHLKNHPDFAEKHVSKAGRPTGTTKVAAVQKDLAKKKQDSAFSMWAGLGKK